MTPRQTAQEGLLMLKEAILAYLHSHQGQARHADIVEDLGLYSDFEGSSRNYLSYSVLGILMNEAKVTSEKQGRDRVFKLEKN
jgi:hypothetical protein